jgi:hypothetical protein
VKWTIFAGVLVLCMVAVLVWTVTRLTSSLEHAESPPKSAVALFDMTTGEQMKIDSLELAMSFPKDPDTGFWVNSSNHHLLAPAIKCASCGRLIPPPTLSTKLSQEEYERLRKEHRCPICGDAAYAH